MRDPQRVYRGSILFARFACLRTSSSLTVLTLFSGLQKTPLLGSAAPSRDQFIRSGSPLVNTNKSDATRGCRVHDRRLRSSG
jgi:hypothetical protein